MFKHAERVKPYAANKLIIIFNLCRGRRSIPTHYHTKRGAWLQFPVIKINKVLRDTPSTEHACITMGRA